MSAEGNFFANTSRTHVRSALTPERLEHGYVMVLPGIDGVNFSDYSIQKGLLDSGMPYGIEIYDWTLGILRLFTNLRSKELHAEQSRVIIERIMLYRDCYPGRPIHLIGHSGGAGMALYSLSGLPASAEVSNAVLLGAAVSRHFDVRSALQGVSQCVYNFWSRADLFILGAFTCVAGSLDGCHGPCIGLTGIPSNGLSIEEAAKLVEVPYRWEYLKYGHLGGHFGHASRAFVRHQVAPLLLPDPEQPPVVVNKDERCPPCAASLITSHPANE